MSEHKHHWRPTKSAPSGEAEVFYWCECEAILSLEEAGECLFALEAKLESAERQALELYGAGQVIEEARLDLVAKLEAMEPLVEVAREAERIANEAHLAADAYAYDLMRTVLFPLVGHTERSVEQALAAQRRKDE